MKDFFHATVGEAHTELVGDGSKTYDPMLKLYFHRPVMVNDNLAVEEGLSNGTMAKFLGVRLQEGVSHNDLERIMIDGYYVWCANMTQIRCMVLQLLDGLKNDNEVKVVEIFPSIFRVKAAIPIPLDGTNVTKDTPRRQRRCHFKTFPLNIANARTIHKLQGRSLDNVVINSWQYKDNWIYVALSRVRTLNGLYLRLPLQHSGCKPMSQEIRQFMDKLRRKQPPTRVKLSDKVYE